MASIATQETDQVDGNRGVFILVFQLYDIYQLEELIVESSSDFEVVLVKVKVLGTSNLYIGSFYRPPDKNDPEYLQQLHSLLNRTPTDKGAHLRLVGVFNLPDINWEDESVSQYASNTSVAHQLLNTTRDVYLDQVVTEPTRVTETSSSILDLFFTSNQTLIKRLRLYLEFQTTKQSPFNPVTDQ